MTDFDYSDRLNSLIDEAEEEWMSIARVTGAAGRMLDCESTLEQDVAMMQKIIGDLIDHGALPGDLTDDQPTFKPWPGTKAELLERFRTEMLKLGRLPGIGEICWIHIPPGKRRFPDHESSPADYATGLRGLVEIAEQELISMALVSGLSGRVLGPDAGFDQHVPVMIRIVGDLIDRGAVLSDMVDPGTTNPRERPIRGPKYERWAGDKEDWLARFRNELEALGRLPDLGEIGWLHIPAKKADQP